MANLELGVTIYIYIYVLYIVPWGKWEVFLVASGEN